MSNGIIEIGIPKNCDECPIRQVALAYCLIAKKSTSHHPSGKALDQSKRPDWCPIKTKADNWIPVSEHLPEAGSYVLLSFENVTIPNIGRYETDEEGGAFYSGDDDESYVEYGIFVNAWRPLPELYRR